MVDRAEWIERVLGVNLAYLDLAVTPPAPVEKESAATVRNGLDLAEQTRGAAPAAGIPLEELAALHRQAAVLRQKFTAFATRGAETTAEEWQPVLDIAHAAERRLGETELRANDLEDAGSMLLEAEQAGTDAIAAAQTRLELRAGPLRDRVQAARGHEHAGEAEWKAARDICDKIDGALPAGSLTAAAVDQAGKDVGALDPAIQQAEAKLQGRLRTEADAVLKEADAAATADPEATGDEWSTVLAARKTVGEAVAGDTLRRADVTAASARLVDLEAAADTARQAIQDRLRDEAQAVVDAATRLRTPDPSAVGTEWDRVVIACDAAIAAVPAGPLTAALVAGAGKLRTKAGVVARTVAANIQTRLRKDVAAVRKDVDAALAACGEGGPGLSAVERSCNEIVKLLQTKPMTGQIVTDARDRLAALDNADTQERLRQAWKDEQGKSVAALRAQSKEVLRAPLTGNPTVVAISTLNKAALPTADFATFRANKAELARLTAAGGALIAALNERLASDPKSDGETLKVLARQHTAQRLHDRARADAAAELAEIDGLKAEALAVPAWRKALEEANKDNDVEKSLKRAAGDLTRLYGSLNDELTRNQGWKRDWATTAEALQKPTFTEEDLARAQGMVDRWRKALEQVTADRRKIEAELAALRALYADGTSAMPLDQLEAVHDQVKAGLAKAKASAIRNKLTAGRAAPLAVWQKTLAEALTSQLETPASATEWATRFGLGTIGKNNSWGIDNFCQVGNTNCHLTLYPKDGAAYNITAQQIVNTVLSTGTGGVHTTMERYGKDNPNNPKVYRGGIMLKSMNPQQEQSMQAALTVFVTGCVNTAQGFINRFGLTQGEHDIREAYLAEVKAELAELS